MKRSLIVPGMGWVVLAVVLLVTSVGWQQPRRLDASTTSQSQPALAQPETGQPEVLGDVHFPSSCNEEAQTELNRAVALLHSFWRGPALQSFGRVAELDEG